MVLLLMIFGANCLRLQNYDPMFLGNALTCSFEDRNTLSTRDLALIKELGLTFRGRRKWPWLRYHEIGYYPWYMDDEQARFMALVLEQALDVSLLCQESRSALDTPDGAIPVRVLAPSGSWEFKPVTIKEAQITVTVPVLRDEFLQRFTSLSHSADVCEIDMFYMPSPIQETQGNRPYYPTACILLDSRGLICGMELIKDPVEEAAQSVNLLLDYIADQRRLPLEVRASNQVAYLVCQGVCSQLGISLKRVKKLRWHRKRAGSCLGDSNFLLFQPSKSKRGVSLALFSRHQSSFTLHVSHIFRCYVA